MGRTAGLGSKHLLGLDVEQEGLNWDGWVQLLVNIQGDVLDAGWHYSAIPIIQVEKISQMERLPKLCWPMPRAGLYVSGTAQS